jgi:hypothetical protein
MIRKAVRLELNEEQYAELSRFVAEIDGEIGEYVAAGKDPYPVVLEVVAGDAKLEAF